MPKIPTSDELTGTEQAPPGQASPPGPAFDADHALRTAQVNEALVKNAQAGWLDGMNALLYHPDTGFLNQRGAPAVGSYGSLQDAMDKLYRQTTDSLSDDTQRGMFERTTAPLLDAIRGQVSQHADAQCRVFDADASRARSRSAIDLAVNAYTPGADNALYRSSAAIAHNELQNAFCHAHGDPEDAGNKALWEHYLQFGPEGDGGMCAIHTGIVNRLLESNQPDDARTYLDDVQHTLPASTRDKLAQFIRTGEDRQQALAAVLQAQAKAADPAGQQKALDGMRDDGKLNDDAHAIASHSLQAAQQQQLAVQKQNDEQSLARVWDLKHANPNAALTDIPASTLAYLTSRGLDKSAEAILSSHPATDDPALFNRFHRLASADPVKFAQTSLIASSGRLSGAHMDYLQKLQDAINRQDPQAIAASRQVEDAVQTVQQEMKISGIDLQPEPGSDREKQLAQMESGLRDRIIAAQQAKNGAPLSSDEVQNLAMGYFAGQVLKGGDAKQPQGGQQGAETQNTDHPQSQGDSKQIFPRLPDIMPHGAPVAAGTTADERKAYPAALAVGQQMPNGKIAAGDDPDSRVYVVKAEGKGKTVDLWKISEETGCDFDQLKALNKIKREGAWIPNGAKLLLPPQPADGPAHQPVMDVEKSAAALDSNAKGNPTHFCSRAVFKAINAGRPADRQITGPGYAKDAGPILEKAGFTKVLASSDQLASYTPRKGDIVVLQDYPNQDPPAGHIAMFDGKHWVSDYVQDKKYGSRIWAGGSFENNKVGMAIYRP